LEGGASPVLIKEILDQGLRSVSIIGMGKNTGKTFSFNQLLMEAGQIGIRVALTTIGLDGEEKDQLFYHDKPRITLRPGQMVANAKSLLLESGLDYEILGSTGIMTPLGEVILARALSAGKTVLAGPSTGHELALVKEQFEEYGMDLFLIDGAIDRRSLSAPMVTDTTILAVGAEVSWDTQILLEKIQHKVEILTLPSWNNEVVASHLRAEVLRDDVKLVALASTGPQGQLTHGDLLHNLDRLEGLLNEHTDTVFVQGMLTDEVLAKILACKPHRASFTLLITDPNCVFLGKRALQRLQSNTVELRVLDSIHVSAVTVNPFNSRYGIADPLRLLRDVGQAVYPIPTYDLNLGIRYRPEKEAFNGIS